MRMLNDIEDGKDGVDFVLVFKLSRFGRNAADVLSSLQLMQDYGVNLRILNCWHQLRDYLIFRLIHYFLFMKNFQILKSKKLSGRWTGCSQKKAMKRLMNGQ